MNIYKYKRDFFDFITITGYMKFALPAQKDFSLLLKSKIENFLSDIVYLYGDLVLNYIFLLFFDSPLLTFI